MQDETTPFTTNPLLELAYKERNRDPFTKLILEIPFGVHFSVDHMVMVMQDPTPSEMIIFKQSQNEGREVGLVKVGQKMKTIEGQGHAIDNPEQVIEAIREMGSNIEPKSFSHTHTADPSINPLPSIRDTTQFWRLRKIYPDCECRIVTAIEGKMMSIVYLGDSRDLLKMKNS